MEQMEEAIKEIRRMARVDSKASQALVEGIYRMLVLYDLGGLNSLESLERRRGGEVKS